jgi:hypothetical protein
MAVSKDCGAEFLLSDLQRKVTTFFAAENLRMC